MSNRVVMIGGWRAYLLGGVVLAGLLALLLAASVFLLALLAIGGVTLIAHRVLRAFKPARPAPRRAYRAGEVIEGEYRVVDRRLPEA